MNHLKPSIFSFLPLVLEKNPPAKLTKTAICKGTFESMLFPTTPRVVQTVPPGNTCTFAGAMAGARHGDDEFSVCLWHRESTNKQLQQSGDMFQQIWWICWFGLNISLLCTSSKSVCEKSNWTQTSQFLQISLSFWLRNTCCHVCFVIIS